MAPEGRGPAPNTGTGPREPLERREGSSEHRQASIERAVLVASEALLHLREKLRAEGSALLERARREVEAMFADDTAPYPPVLELIHGVLEPLTGEGLLPQWVLMHDLELLEQPGWLDCFVELAAQRVAFEQLLHARRSGARRSRSRYGELIVAAFERIAEGVNGVECDDCFGHVALEILDRTVESYLASFGAPRRPDEVGALAMAVLEHEIARFVAPDGSPVVPS